MGDKMYVDYTQLGKRIASRRRSLGMKQAEVNEKAGLSDKYLSHIETGRTIPSIDVLMKICAALDTTPDYLLLGALQDGNDNMSEAAVQKIKMIKGGKKSLLYNFIDWLAEQNL